MNGRDIAAKMLEISLTALLGLSACGGEAVSDAGGASPEGISEGSSVSDAGGVSPEGISGESSVSDAGGASPEGISGGSSVSDAGGASPEGISEGFSGPDAGEGLAEWPVVKYGSDAAGSGQSGRGPGAAGVELPQPYAEYLELLEMIMEEGQDTCGIGYISNPGSDFSENDFAICDVDGDGRQELLFRFSQGSMAGIRQVVYEYDGEADAIYVEWEGWLNSEYYETGLIRENASHNHGKDPYERGVWPYLVYQYDAETDRYQLVYTVDAWDGSVRGDGFPEELDRDGDQLVYCVTAVNGGRLPELSAEDSRSAAAPESASGETEVILDREEYENWTNDLFPEWSREEIIYHPMTEDFAEIVNNAYARALAYGNQADIWFMEKEVGGFEGYLLYDLDGDGSLELTVSVMQGTGRYSDNHFYSLSEDGKVEEFSFVRLCDGREREWNAVFDIVRAGPLAYQDRDGVIYYEGNDRIQEGKYGSYDETGFYYLKDGILYQDSLRRCSTVYHVEEGQEDEITYYNMTVKEDGSPEEITEKEYEAIRDDYIAGMAEREVYQNWVHFNEAGGTELTEEIIGCRLLDSFLGSR